MGILGGRGAQLRPEAPEVRPQARREAGCRHRRSRPRLAGRAARRCGRPARLRLPARPQGAAARLAERLQAGHSGAAGDAVSRRARLRGAGCRARDPARPDRPERPPPLESRRDARDPACALTACGSLPRRRLPPRADCAGAPGCGRRRREERRDRGRLDRRQGDAGPLHAPRRRPLPGLRLRAARRLHHTGALGGRARARPLRRASTAARSRRSAT